MLPIFLRELIECFQPTRLRDRSGHAGIPLRHGIHHPRHYPDVESPCGRRYENRSRVSARSCCHAGAPPCGLILRGERFTAGGNYRNVSVIGCSF